MGREIDRAEHALARQRYTIGDRREGRNPGIVHSLGQLEGSGVDGECRTVEDREARPHRQFRGAVLNQPDTAVYDRPVQYVYRPGFCAERERLVLLYLDLKIRVRLLVRAYDDIAFHVEHANGRCGST